jgi:regulation of enolase protein 1 (concanavalin A-like superfamily)
MDNTTRRSFLMQAVSLAGPLALTKATVAGTTPGDLISRMTWFNEPARSDRVGDQLIVHSRPKTDFWRNTFYGTITDNGHFLPMRAAGDFTFEARVNGRYSALYDQAGLMVRVSETDWLKCGTEFFDEKRHARLGFTREFSDWSTMPDLTETGPVWWRAVRKRESIETLCSLDGKDFTSVPQGYDPASAAEVGIMGAAREGAGFAAEFLSFSPANQLTACSDHSRR